MVRAAPIRLSAAERRRFRIGAVLATLLIAAAGVGFSLDLIVRAGLEGPRVTVSTHSAGGLGPGAPVWVAGRPAGRVLEVSFLPPEAARAAPGAPRVLIEGVLERSAGSALRADASASVRIPDAVGATVLALEPGTGALPPWNYADTLRGLGSPYSPETVAALADTLREAIRRLAAQAGEARAVLAGGTGSLGRLRARPETLADFADALGALARLATEDLPASPLGRLARDTLVAPALARSRARMSELGDSPALDSTERHLRLAASDADAATGRLRRIAARLERGEGTLGRARLDGELAARLTDLRHEADAVLAALLHGPGGWLRVEFF